MITRSSNEYRRGDRRKHPKTSTTGRCWNFDHYSLVADAHCWPFLYSKISQEQKHKSFTPEISFIGGLSFHASRSDGYWCWFALMLPLDFFKMPLAWRFVFANPHKIVADFQGFCGTSRI